MGDREVRGDRVVLGDMWFQVGSGEIGGSGLRRETGGSGVCRVAYAIQKS